jgi:hypothetical protein
MSDLRTIVYASTAVAPFDVPQLEALLVEARARNRQRGITGVLLYCDGSFMQCLEGPGTVVRETFELIRASRRHTGIIELLDAPIQARSFRYWQLGLAVPNASEVLELSTAQWQVAADRSLRSGHRPHGLVLLRSFWDRMRR